jgi:hypothetical protein
MRCLLRRPALGTCLEPNALAPVLRHKADVTALRAATIGDGFLLLG